MRYTLYITIVLLAFGCKTAKKQQKADKILFNATFYTLANNAPNVEAVVIKDGKILATGKKDSLLALYDIATQVDLKGAFVYPGFIDGHSHFYGLGQFTTRADFTNSESFDEVLDRLKVFADNHLDEPWLLGRGWDQNLWQNKQFPEKTQLDKLFPDKPVLLKRVDGHAAIANQKALDLAGINTKTVIAGGKVEVKNGKLTGILVDNAVDSLEKFIPQPTDLQIYQYLLKAQQICFENGLTTVTDAGLDKRYIKIIRDMQEKGELKIRLYVMANADKENLDYYITNGPIKTPLLNVSSFKLYGDGSLGSRGACLIHPYHDAQSTTGFLLSPPQRIKEVVAQVAKSKFQLCTHAIGDSTNRFVLDAYGAALGQNNNRRWRIEHAQVVQPADTIKYKLFGILPSMQPTHATSDMAWADERLGAERIKYAYMLKTMMNQNGLVILGTDFPVEAVSPLATFYSAVARTDSKGKPANGFQPENALSRIEALKGITIWAAYGSFEENEKGTIEAGKYADFTVLDTDLLKADIPQLIKAKYVSTWVGGIKVFGE